VEVLQEEFLQEEDLALEAAAELRIRSRSSTGGAEQGRHLGLLSCSALPL